MINNDLRIEPYRARLDATGRVQVPGFLQEPSAQRLRDCLEREVPWEPAQRSDRPPLLSADAQALHQRQSHQCLHAAQVDAPVGARVLVFQRVVAVDHPDLRRIGGRG